MNEEKIAEIIHNHRFPSPPWIHEKTKPAHFEDDKKLAKQIMSLFPPNFMIEIDCLEGSKVLRVSSIKNHFLPAEIVHSSFCICKGTGKVLSPLKVDLVGTIKEGVENG